MKLQSSSKDKILSFLKNKSTLNLKACIFASASGLDDFIPSGAVRSRKGRGRE